MNGGGGGGGGDREAGGGAAAAANGVTQQPSTTPLPSSRPESAGAAAASAATKRPAPAPAPGGETRKHPKKAGQEFINNEVKFGAQPSAAATKTIRVIKGMASPTYAAVLRKIRDMSGGAGFARDVGYGVPMLAREYPNIASPGFHSGRELAPTLFELLTTHSRFRDEEYHISKGEESYAARANLRGLVRSGAVACAPALVARGH